VLKVAIIASERTQAAATSTGDAPEVIGVMA
jgi:hypothetical protein